jgi:hypothetical protein
MTTTAKLEGYTFTVKMKLDAANEVEARSEFKRFLSRGADGPIEVQSVEVSPVESFASYQQMEAVIASETRIEEFKQIVIDLNEILRWTRTRERLQGLIAVLQRRINDEEEAILGIRRAAAGLAIAMTNPKNESGSADHPYQETSAPPHQDPMKGVGETG